MFQLTVSCGRLQSPEVRDEVADDPLERTLGLI
jgi:hypothetical protein